jgi:hypothetical protein
MSTFSTNVVLAAETPGEQLDGLSAISIKNAALVGAGVVPSPGPILTPPARSSTQRDHYVPFGELQGMPQRIGESWWVGS